MAGEILSGVTRVVLSHGPKAMWDQYDPVLFEGEVGFETQTDGAWKVKVGNGQTPWHLLDYSIDFQAIMAAMAAAALSATNAATSETNAANSATAAAGSEQSVADNAAAALQSKIAAAHPRQSRATLPLRQNMRGIRSMRQRGLWLTM